MAEVKRLNYFTFQFLVEKDFDDEQAYHLGMRRLHNRLLHTWGVAEGLEVTKTGDRQVSLGPGTAIDREGQEIVLPADPTPDPIDLTEFGPDAEVFLTIDYQEVFDETDHYTSGGVDDYTRTTERPLLSASTADPPEDGSVIPLARVQLDSSGNVGTIESHGFRAGSTLAPETVGTGQLVDDVVTSAKIAEADGTSEQDTSIGAGVKTEHLQDEAITEPKLADDSVTAPKIAANAVTGPKIADNAITGPKLANNAVDGAKIRDGSLGTGELANNAVTNAKLANNAVSATKIQNGTVGSGKLANNAVTNAKLANNAVNAAKIADGSVGTVELANLAVTNPKLANNAVNAAKIQDGSVGTGELANNAVTNAKLADNAVTGRKIAEGALVVTTTSGYSSYFRAGQPFNGLRAGVGATSVSSGWVSGVEGQAFGTSGYGVAANSDTGNYSLYVRGTSFFGGAKTGYVVDIFINRSGQRLRTGDVVKMKGTPIVRFQGDQNKIPIPEITLAEKEADNMVIGVVDREAIPEQDVPDTRVDPEDSTLIDDDGEVFVVTLGTYSHCKVDATEEPIEVGDLLTTSDNSGHAKKATDPKIGTIIGKALESLAEGTGYIAVFVSIK